MNLIVKCLLTVCLLSGYAVILEASPQINEKVVLFPFNKAVISSLVDTVLIKFNFKEGESFYEGDSLAELDSSLYFDAYERSIAEKMETEASYDYAKDVYDFNLELIQKDAISTQELDRSKLDMLVARARNMQSTSNANATKYKLDSCIIKAPFNGRIDTIFANEYEYATVNKPILEIIDDSKLLATAHIPVEYLHSVKMGESVVIFVDEVNKNIVGQIYEISGTINPVSRTIEIKILIDNNNKMLMAGMSGHIQEIGNDNKK